MTTRDITGAFVGLARYLRARTPRYVAAPAVDWQASVSYSRGWPFSGNLPAGRAH